MGKELKRVPLDFNAPIGETWIGYINPHPYLKCNACGGHGYSKIARRAQDRWYGFAPFVPEDNGSEPFSAEHPVIMALAHRNVYRDKEGASSDEYFRGVKAEARRLAKLFNGSWSHHLNHLDVAALIDDDRLWEFTHDFVQGKGWQKKATFTVPTAAEINIWSLQGLGHDACNCWTVVKAWCKRNGAPYECPICGGSGWASKEARIAHDEWERKEPPTGEGYQLWETTSDGSPISLVFKTLDKLCAWAAVNATTFGDHKASKAEWRKMLDEGLVYLQKGNMVFI